MVGSVRGQDTELPPREPSPPFELPYVPFLESSETCHDIRELGDQENYILGLATGFLESKDGEAFWHASQTKWTAEIRNDTISNFLYTKAQENLDKVGRIRVGDLTLRMTAFCRGNPNAKVLLALWRAWFDAVGEYDLEQASEP
jgi:hypothetical protein